MANLHEWRKRAALHTRCHGGVPAEFMRASFAHSKQLLSATALWETLCMKLEGWGKVANQWLRQVALKLLDVLQIEQLAVPLRSGQDQLGEVQWKKRSFPFSYLISPTPFESYTPLFQWSLSANIYVPRVTSLCFVNTNWAVYAVFFRLLLCSLQMFATPCTNTEQYLAHS